MASKQGLGTREYRSGINQKQASPAFSWFGGIADFNAYMHGTQVLIPLLSLPELPGTIFDLLFGLLPHLTLQASSVQLFGACTGSERAALGLKQRRTSWGIDLDYNPPMPPRNLTLYFLAQLIFVSGSVLIVTLGGIVGSEMAPDPTLATLPLSVMVVGTALATVPAALLMQRIGRRLGFAVGACLAISGALLAVLGLQWDSFALFAGAVGLIGATLAFSAQFRFAAAESGPPERAGWAISIILLGSIGGALVGPELATRSPQWLVQRPYQGGLLALAVLYGIALCLLLGTRNSAPAPLAKDAGGQRPLQELVRQPAFLVAVLAGVVGQGAMIFIMTATPIAMHVLDGHGIEATARVIQAHVVAMYLPSLVSAPLIDRFGAHRLMAAGALAMAATVACGLAGRELLHYWWALVLLGLGWNFLFVGGTTALVASYRPQERFRAQAVNDFSIFGASALASLFAGALLHRFGWSVLLLSVLPPLALMLAVALLGRRVVLRTAARS